jgi:AraC family transcriptional regulator of adaptative response / DNA-3-methyladenine glycosylase II
VSVSAAVDAQAEGFEAWFRAAESRDPRFDGRVVVAVTTTGVYCRPSCPSPMPRPRNVRFFRDGPSATLEGFRPCRRCRPGALPARSAELVDRALELVSTDRDEGLARRLGLEAGRLRRAFVAELGVTPTSLVRAVRACGPVSIDLPFRPPFDADGLLAFLQDRAIPGVEEVRGRTYRRSLTTPRGPATLSLTPLPASDGVRLDATVADVAGLRSVVRTARSMFDLDVDPAAVARTLADDPVLRPAVRKRPGVRLPGVADGSELLVRAVVGQQVSVAAARTMLGRIAGRFGERIAGVDPAVATAFPTSEALAEAPLEELGVIGRRASAIRAVAAMVASGELTLDGSADPDETVGRLLQIDGIGPWTAGYVRMRALRDPDAFVEGDLGVRRGFERLGLDATQRAMLARSEAWRPWRAYAVMLLWGIEP